MTNELIPLTPLTPKEPLHSKDDCLYISPDFSVSPEKIQRLRCLLTIASFVKKNLLSMQLDPHKREKISAFVEDLSEESDALYHSLIE